MNDEQFREFLGLLQDTSSIVQNQEKLRFAYSEFNKLFNYLDTKEWQEDNIAEAHEYKENAVFQNAAEGYFRLGFVEKAFFQYSKMLYELWYEKALEIQDKLNKRIHKGTQLHQIASIYEIFNEHYKAWGYYLAGFIEDVIDGRDYSEHQGYRSLRRFNLSSNNLDLIAKKVKGKPKDNKFDSLFISEILKREFIIPTYEENESVDHIKLSRTKSLWIKLKESWKK